MRKGSEVGVDEATATVMVATRSRSCLRGKVGLEHKQ